MEQSITRRQLAALFVLVLLALGANYIVQATAPIGRDMSSSPTVQALLHDRIAPSREVRDPTLTLVVFSDYQCPACKLSNPAMEAAVARDGHVRVVYQDWPIFGVQSERAARIAIAADLQGLYASVHSRLMNERRPLGDGVLRAAVEQSGGNWSLLQRDLKMHAVKIDEQLAKTVGIVFLLGIEGTPAYLAGPVLITGGLDEAEFTRAFALGRRKASRE
jgi:protein-disulfide isomerase